MKDSIGTQPIIDDFEFELRGDTAQTSVALHEAARSWGGVPDTAPTPIIAQFAGKVRAFLDGLRLKSAGLMNNPAPGSCRHQATTLPFRRTRSFRAVPARVRFRQSALRSAAPLTGAGKANAAPLDPGSGSDAADLPLHPEGASGRDGELEANSRNSAGASDPAP